MAWAVANRSQVIFEERKSGALSVIYVPSFDQVRTFNDIPAINGRSVQERYGETSTKVLWRQLDGVVYAYGILRDELSDRRQGVEIFLPQDFAPDETDSLYYVLNRTTVVHGVCQRNDDGEEEWKVSLIPVKAKQNLAELLEISITERFLQRTNEQICLAVLDNNELQKELTQRLEAYKINAMDMNLLTKRKGTKALYMHHDFSMLLLILPLIALGLLALVITLWVLAQVRLAGLEEDSRRLEDQIRRVQMDSPLATIDNPLAVQQRLEKPISIQPSSLAHAAAEVGSQFGPLVEVSLRNFTTKDAFSVLDTVRASVKLDEFENQKLVDQERLAELLIQERPWVRSIERAPANKDVIIELQVKEEGP